MCRTGGRRCPSSRTPSTGGTHGRATPGQGGDTPPPATPSPGQGGDTPGGAHYNIATGNARVGWQADRVIIMGGLTIDEHTGDTPPPGTPGPSWEGDTPRVHNVVTGNAHVGRQTGGTPAGDTGPGAGQGGDTPGAVYVNFANDNARIGVQAREVTITGGLTIGGPPNWRTPPGGDASPRSGPGARIQIGVLNGAGTSDVIGVQAQDVHGNTRPADGEGDGQ
jgi:hypothetical protein